MYHKITALGYLGMNPEIKFTPQGKAVTNFSLAVSDGFGDKKKTIWFRVTVWGKQAESCNEHLTKGRGAVVEGRLQADDKGNPKTFERKDGTTGSSFEITATDVRFLPSGGGVKSKPVQDDDIPF